MSDRPKRYTPTAGLTRYLDTTTMSIWRWERDPALNFPPAAVINKHRYHDLDAIDEWMRARVVGRSLEAASAS